MEIKVGSLVAVKLEARKKKCKSRKLNGFIGIVKAIRTIDVQGTPTSTAEVDFQCGVGVYSVSDLMDINKDTVRTFPSYRKMQEAHQQDINDFPITYMFGIKKDDEIKEDIALIGAGCFAECTSIFGCGDVIRKVDVKHYLCLSEKHRRERELLFKDEKKLYDAILSEMYNHEYGLTYSDSEVLSALGMTSKDLQTNKVLANVWDRASKECVRNSI